MMPRPSILYVKVSREGKTLDARILTNSNDPTFDVQALELAKRLQWNPAKKNGEPVEAWVQWLCRPERQQ